MPDLLRGHWPRVEDVELNPGQRASMSPTSSTNQVFKYIPIPHLSQQDAAPDNLVG